MASSGNPLTHADHHARRVGARAESAARHAHAHAKNADWRSKLARAGLVAKGILYGALGALAIQFASGQSSSPGATKQGAIEMVASQPMGQVLLVVLTVGLFALCLWRAICAVTGDPVEGSEAKDRAKFALLAFLYFGTASTALGVLLAHGGGSGGAGGGGSSQQQAAATIMSWPGGQWLVAILGLVLVVFAVRQVVKHGKHKEFMQRIARSEMREKVERAVARAGQAGYTARAVVLAITGIFFVVAAIQHNPDQAVGLSGALAALAAQPWGQAILWVVAIGLFLYGMFCLAEAKYRRAT